MNAVLVDVNLAKRARSSLVGSCVLGRRLRQVEFFKSNKKQVGGAGKGKIRKGDVFQKPISGPQASLVGLRAT